VRDGHFRRDGRPYKRKLLPALYNLASDGFLPDKFAIIGVGRQEMTTEEFRKDVIGDLKEFIRTVRMKNLSSGSRSGHTIPAAILTMTRSFFGDLKAVIADVVTTHQIPRIISITWRCRPICLRPLPHKIARNGLAKEDDGHWRRFIYEKPFGRDLESPKS